MRIFRIGSVYRIIGEEAETCDSLPVQTYLMSYNDKEGCFLVKHPNITVQEKTYGVHNKKIQKVMQSFESFERSLGVILSGDKGIGKSIFAKMLCEQAVKNGYPVIIVDEAVPGLSRFIESIEQECIVLFDEFDKTFRAKKDEDDQAKLLSLFDGTAGGKKLYVVTCNELRGLNDYIVNRPGRFHYHFRFGYPAADDIREYLADKLDECYYPEIENVVIFAEKINLNYDCLRAIAFELNMGSSFTDAIADLNILNVSDEKYDVFLYFENGDVLWKHRYAMNLFEHYDKVQRYEWVGLEDNEDDTLVLMNFRQKDMRYDMSQGGFIIPADKVKLDFEYYENSKAKKYAAMKPTYVYFVKSEGKSLHYEL